jgi:hypothetical protein
MQEVGGKNWEGGQSWRGLDCSWRDSDQRWRGSGQRSSWCQRWRFVSKVPKMSKAWDNVSQMLCFSRVLKETRYELIQKVTKFECPASRTYVMRVKVHCWGYVSDKMSLNYVSMGENHVCVFCQSICCMRRCLKWCLLRNGQDWGKAGVGNADVNCLQVMRFERTSPTKGAHWDWSWLIKMCPNLLPHQKKKKKKWTILVGQTDPFWVCGLKGWLNWELPQPLDGVQWAHWYFQSCL